MQLTFAGDGSRSSSLPGGAGYAADLARRAVFAAGAVPLLLDVVRLVPANSKRAIQLLEYAIQVRGWVAGWG